MDVIVSNRGCARVGDTGCSAESGVSSEQLVGPPGENAGGQLDDYCPEGDSDFGVCMAIGARTGLDFCFIPLHSSV